MIKWLTRAARELNWARRAWSTETDREFHEELYRVDDYDPFSWAYPGYTTIRRFADIVERHLPPGGLVVDLGCGPGEITCELAARRTGLAFLGLDHSTAAIAKARVNAGRRGLTNVRFEARDVEDYVPDGSVDLVALFDSFHHLMKPAEFVARLSPHVKRWALIEPRGGWAGTWQKDIDFDWLAHDLDKIRARVAASIGASAFAPTAPQELRRDRPGTPTAQPDLAIERRYTLDDLRRFFDGYALDLRGTVAGLESYPPGANLARELREPFGEMRYQLYCAIDEWLFERNLDLHAKHWLIVAERGGRSRSVALSNIKPEPAQGARISGQYDVRYGNYRGPRSAAPDERQMGAIELTNDGWDTWTSDVGGIFTSYHWLDTEGRIVELDGERTPLPRPIAAGDTCEVTIRIRTPSRAGRYQLAIDLVREGVTWFSEAGHPWLAVDFDVHA